MKSLHENTAHRSESDKDSFFAKILLSGNADIKNWSHPNSSHNFHLEDAHGGNH
jgi:hypothetical protein